MKNKDEIILLGKKTIQLEADSLTQMASFIDESFYLAVSTIYESIGRVIVTGIGKSAIIAQKIVATLNSTGTPSVFMHAADAIHGDLGSITTNDVIICISKSGNTPEIKILLQHTNTSANKLIAICGNNDSFLGKCASIFLNTFVEKEACPNNLAPTTSTTAQMAMGDALAVALLKMRNFSELDFAKFHPGGTLGKQLYLKVNDVFLNNEKPIVKPTSNIKNVLFEISSKRLGATAVIDNETVCGVITDGDIRRMLEKNDNFTEVFAGEIMNKYPKTIDKNALAIDALNLMKMHNINQLLVLNDSKYVGFIHIQDLMREGIV